MTAGSYTEIDVRARLLVLLGVKVVAGAADFEGPVAAAREFLRRVDVAASVRRSFALETTLASRTYLRRIGMAAAQPDHDYCGGPYNLVRKFVYPKRLSWKLCTSSSSGETSWISPV